MNLTSQCPVLSTSFTGKFGSCTHTGSSSPLKSHGDWRRAVWGGEHSSVRQDIYVSPSEQSRRRARLQHTEFILLEQTFLHFSAACKTTGTGLLASIQPQYTQLCFVRKNTGSRSDCSFSSSTTHLTPKLRVTSSARIEYCKCFYHFSISKMLLLIIVTISRDKGKNINNTELGVQGMA